ncbi:MAG TPA: porin [Longimicrobiales bacterium]
MRAYAAVILGLLLLLPGRSAAQTSDADFRIRLIGRIQAQFNSTSVDEAELVAAGLNPQPIPATNFDIRRLRFGAELEYDKWLTGKIEVEMAMARLQMRDVFVNFGFDPALNLRVGQFKKPYSLLQLYSSSMWPVIERGVLIRGITDAMLHADSTTAGGRLLSSFRGVPVLPEEQALLEVFGYQNFDLGAAVHGKIGGFGYSAGLFNGAGSDRPDDTNAQSYAARITYKLPTDLPITLGSALSHRNYRVSNRPTIQTNSGTAYEFDVEVGAFRGHGLHILGEVAFGENLAVADDDFLGGQAIVAWFQPINDSRIEGVEVAGRASYGDPRRDFDDDGGWFYTPGVNLYFSGRNRLMFNWDVFAPKAERFDSENAVRIQAQVYF